MDLLKTILLLLIFSSGFLLIIGLYKPWIVLWWKAVSNRLMVLKLYGIIFLLSLLGFLIINQISF
jgi:hypothetical protein